jgi:hypothetical protein
MSRKGYTPVLKVRYEDRALRFLWDIVYKTFQSLKIKYPDVVNGSTVILFSMCQV